LFDFQVLSIVLITIIYYGAHSYLTVLCAMNLVLYTKIECKKKSIKLDDDDINLLRAKIVIGSTIIANNDNRVELSWCSKSDSFIPKFYSSMVRCAPTT
jgi:hypothetical protein